MKKALLLIYFLLLFATGYAQLIRGPYLQVATSTSIVIRWRTETPTDSRIRYGTSPDALNQTVNDNNAANDHEIKVTGLSAKTRYYYSIGSSSVVYQGGLNNYFETAPLPGSKGRYRFGVLGDCGTNSAIQGNVRDQLSSYLGNNYMNALLLLGDNAYSFGYDAEYQSNFFNHYKDSFLSKVPMFPAPGNHDYNNDHPERQKDHKVAYYDNFSMPVHGEAGGVPSENKAFYSFDYGNVHFLSLDSYGLEDQSTRLYDTLGRQALWVKADLAANKNKEWVVAYWHHPPYSLGSRNSDTEDELIKIRENFIKILERNGVDLILCGHSHVYERSKLMKGHYDKTNTFNAQVHNLSQSSGKYDGSQNSCPYIKSSADNKGTVYVVAGSSGQIGAPKPGFPQQAMYYSNAEQGGSLLLEVEGNRLDAKWIAADGQIRDQFTIEKDVNKRTPVKLDYGASITLTPSFSGTYSWNTGAQTKSITVSPKADAEYIVRDEYRCLADTFNVKVAASPVVKINAFTASADKSNVINLAWQTESEFGLSHFLAEQSENGRDFIELGRINASDKPGQKNDYSYTDAGTSRFYNGETISYRLKLIYQDGRTGYSSVISVKLHVIPPFNLISFEGLSDAGNVVNLTWKTGSERKTSHFLIERSLNKTDFTEIGRKDAAQNSAGLKTYELKDATSSIVTNEDTLYYRLKMVGQDGTNAHSAIIAVKLFQIILGTDPASGPGIEVLPNPSAPEEVQIRLVGKTRLLINLSVIDVSGKTILHKKTELTSTPSHFLPAGISAGVYFVKVVIDGRTIIRKFVLL